MNGIAIGGKALPIPFGENILRISYNKTTDNINRFLDTGENITNNPNLKFTDLLKEHVHSVRDNLIHCSITGTSKEVKEGGLKVILEELGFNVIN